MPRITTRRWFPLVWAVPAGVVLVIAAVLVTRALRDAGVFDDFLRQYPGDSALPPGAPVGFPAWLAWQHALNTFFLVFIARSGLRIRSKRRPPAFVTPRRPRLGRLSLHVWWHLVVDTLWALNGLLFYVLIFTTGQWTRIVPVHWDVVPNAVSAGIQYLSFDWPVAHGWVNYNGLQLLAYSATVFIAAPLALVTGLRLSPLWPRAWARGERLARSVHFWVFVYFIVFTIGHVTLVFATGALQNLNHMYGGRDDQSWVGAIIFAIAFAVMVAGWVLLREPLQARIARLGADVRLLPPPPSDGRG